MMRSLTFSPGERDIFRLYEDVKVSTWASRNLIVQDGKFAGSPLRLEWTPYLVDIMDSWASPYCEEIRVGGSPQTGKTLLLYACLAYSVDRRPGPRMLTMPTRETRDNVVELKLRPLFRGSPLLRRKLTKALAGRFTFRDGTRLLLPSADSPGQRASITVRDLFCDEEDLYNTTGQSNPVEDFLARTQSYGDQAKRMRVSQLKGEEDSSIWRALTSSDALFAHTLRCPACGTDVIPSEHDLRVASDGTRPSVSDVRVHRLGRFRCPSCKYLLNDHMRDVAVSQGRWVCVRPGGSPGTWEETAEPSRPRIRGYWIPAILSRSVSLSTIIVKKMAAEESDSPVVRRQYMNDQWGLPYTPVEVETDESRILACRDPRYHALSVPAGCVALTCGIDTQKRGFYYAVVGWRQDMSSHVVDYGYVENFSDIARIVFDTWYDVVDENGAKTGEVLPVWRACIDSGGTETDGLYSRTQEVYNFVRFEVPQQGVLFAAKGASRSQTTPVRWTLIDRMPRSRTPIRGGLRLILLDPGVFKSLVFSRLLTEGRDDEPVAMPMRLHAEADEIFARQVASERLVRGSDGKLRWQAVRKDNHYLDCLCGAVACADPSWTPSLKQLLLRQQRMDDEQAQGHVIVQPKEERRSRW